MLLGAGLDTYAWRNPHRDAGVEVFEVDHPATQTWKRELLKRVDLSEPPATRYVPVDFERQSLAACLNDAGFQFHSPAFFTWLGVVPYLTLEAFRSTLRFFGGMAAGSAAVFDYGQPRESWNESVRGAFDGLAARVAKAGEPFQLFLTAEQVAKELEEVGWSVVIDLDRGGAARLVACIKSPKDQRGTSFAPEVAASQLDPTQRFSSRVEDYTRYRPSYPRGVVDLLERECGLNAGSRIADIGSGTGLLAGLFLVCGCEVLGVEPNPEMRHTAERLLADRLRFHSVDGRAEETTLPGRSVDFVTAAQAFHWFEPEPARAEFCRILVPAGWVVLVWNERLRVPGFMAGYEDLVARYGPERPHVETDELDRFFGGTAWRLAKLPNQQQLDLEGLRGRFLSSSYAPLPGTPGHERLMEELNLLFSDHQRNGHVTLLYETEVYFGMLRR